MKLILASNNEHKLVEIRAILGGEFDEILSLREAEAVDAEAIVKLFSSPLGRRMRTAPVLRREFRFSLLCDAADFFPVSPGEQVLLQGVVDCFLEEDGAITVIDYKTDRVRNRAEAEERARVYIPQLRAYAGALRRICGKPVRQCLLYFLSAGEAVELPAEEYGSPLR